MEFLDHQHWTLKLITFAVFLYANIVTDGCPPNIPFLEHRGVAPIIQFLFEVVPTV